MAKKLSELLRTGAAKYKQTRDKYVWQEMDGELRVCAIGAIAAARVGDGADRDSILEEAHIVVFELAKVEGLGCLYDTIISWNDREELSFEEIAQQLEAMGL